MRSLRLAALALLLGSSAAFAAPDAAPAPAGFVLTLSTQEQLDAGLAKLNADHQVALNAFVAREVALARENGLTGFAGTFTSRRSPEERARMGLDRLTADEETKLNELVATALAARVAQPRERPRLSERDLNGPAKKREVHGTVTVGYGWTRGGYLRTGSVWVETYDPESRIGIGVGVSAADGDGWWGWPGYGYGDAWYDDYYPWGYHSGYPVYPSLRFRAPLASPPSGRGRF